jgi:hypothetical protein
MQHPLEFIPQHMRKSLFYVFFALTIVIFGVFNRVDEHLRTDAAPSGTVSFELAREVSAAQGIVDSWDSNALMHAAFGLGLDYLFMPVYALALSLGLLLTLNGRTGWYYHLAAWMGWGIFIAALFDAVENYALWRVLTGDIVSPYPEIAALCATIKFILLITGLLTIVIGKVVRK